MCLEKDKVKYRRRTDDAEVCEYLRDKAFTHDVTLDVPCTPRRLKIPHSMPDGRLLYPNVNKMLT